MLQAKIEFELFGLSLAIASNIIANATVQTIPTHTWSNTYAWYMLSWTECLQRVKVLVLHRIGHAIVQSCILIIFPYRSISLQ